MRGKVKNGIFITFEKTCDGLGGSTQAAILHDALQKAGIATSLSREPGGTEVGKVLRGLLLDYRGNMSKACELLLYQADRAQHYKEVIKPALMEGKVFISDRYWDSTLAYQGAGRGWSYRTLLFLHSISTGGLLPDLTVILDGSPHRAPCLDDRMEKLGAKFFAKVKAGMLQQAKVSDRYVIIDANQPPEIVASHIKSIVQERFSLSF